MSDLGNKEIIAKNIKYYMDLHGKHRKDVCNDLGFVYSTFSDWLNGKKYPRIDKIEMLARYFNISKADLVERKDSRKDDTTASQRTIFETSSDEQTMIKKYRCLDDNGKTMIDGALDNLYQKTIQSRIKGESAG